MASIAQHINATRDTDLRERLVAAAERARVPDPALWVDQNRGAIVAATIDGTTLADLHAYAVASYTPTPRPGADDTKITDAQVAAAVAEVHGA